MAGQRDHIGHAGVVWGLGADHVIGHHRAYPAPPF
jgi:hypothetical protein